MLSYRILNVRLATPALVDHVELILSMMRVSAVASMYQSALKVALVPPGTIKLLVTSPAVPTAFRATNPACAAMSVKAPLAVAPVNP